MRKFLSSIAIAILVLLIANLDCISANFWKADGAKFVLDHPWLSVEDYAISSDSKILNVKSQSDSLYQFDMETGELLKSFVPSINSISKDWKFSEDGDNLIFATFKVNPKKYQNVNHYELDINFYKSNIFDTSIVSQLNYQAFDTNLKKNIEFFGSGYDGRYNYNFDNSYKIFKVNFQEKIKKLSYSHELRGPCTRGYCFILKLTNENLLKKQFLLNGFENFSNTNNNLLYYNGINHFSFINPYKGGENDNGTFSSYYQSLIDLNNLDSFNLYFQFNHDFLKLINNSSYYSIYRVDSNSVNIEKYDKKIFTKQLNVPIKEIQFLKNINDYNLIAVDNNYIKIIDLNQNEILDSINISKDSLELIKFTGNAILAKNKTQIYKFNNRFLNANQYIELNSERKIYYINEEINLKVMSNYKFSNLNWSIDYLKDTSLNFTFKLENSGIYNLKINCKLANGRDTVIKKELILVTRLKPDFYVLPKIYKSNEDIQFANRCIGEHYNLFWDFGDGNTSTEYNPLHSYQQKGNYTIKLKVKDQYFEDSILKEEYVNVDKVGNLLLGYKKSYDRSINQELFSFYGRGAAQRYLNSVKAISNIYDFNQYFSFSLSQTLEDIQVVGYYCQLAYNKYYNHSICLYKSKDTNMFYYDRDPIYYSNSIYSDFLIFDSLSIYTICDLEKIQDLSNKYYCLSKNLWKKFDKKIKSIESFQNDLIVYYINNELECYDMKSKSLKWSSYLDTKEQLIYKSKLFQFNFSLKQINLDKSIDFKVVNNSGFVSKNFSIKLNPLDTIDCFNVKKDQVILASHLDNSQIQVYNWEGTMLSSNYYEDYKKINDIICYKNYTFVSGERKKYSGFLILDSNLLEVKSFRINKLTNINKFAINGNKFYMFNYLIEHSTRSCVYGNGGISITYPVTWESLEILELNQDLHEYMEIENLSSETDVETETPIPSTFSIYPNPAQEQLYIQNICKGKLEILNVFGQQVMEFEIKEDETNKLIDLSTLVNGIYLVQTCQGIQKFVKE